MCTTCRTTSDHARGTAAQRGYGTEHRRRFRAAVLARDQVCVHPDCTDPATEADHHPTSRRDLVAQGLDPNDPRHGRGLCKRHHDQATARHQPGGWAAERG
jgi:5-methylcytosine-specific restriction protein A